MLRTGAVGSRGQVAYSTEFLEEQGNVWVQWVSTEELGQRREFAFRPSAIVYDETSGNLVLALGIQGVLVGTPDGKWTTIAVGML